MSGFEFKLEKVLDLRREEEQVQAQRVAQARREADAAREAMKNLEEVQRDGRTRLAQAHGTGRSVGQLQNFEWLLGRLEGEIHQAQEAVRSADAEMVARANEHREAVRDRQALDRLRQKKLDGWKAGQAREEQKAMDEVAVTRHYHASKKGNGNT